MQKSTVLKLGVFKSKAETKPRCMPLQNGLSSENEELLDLYTDWLLQWGLPDSRVLVKSDYIIPL